jgi:hypothetical protein
LKPSKGLVSMDVDYWLNLLFIWQSFEKDWRVWGMHITLSNWTSFLHQDVGWERTNDWVGRE